MESKENVLWSSSSHHRSGAPPSGHNSALQPMMNNIFETINNKKENKWNKDQKRKVRICEGDRNFEGVEHPGKHPICVCADYLEPVC